MKFERNKKIIFLISLKFIVILIAIIWFIISRTEAQESTSGHTEQEMGEYLGAKSTVYPEWFKDSFLYLSEDITEASEANKQLLLLFSQDNCPYCHALINEVYKDKDAKAFIQSNFDVIHINIWGALEITDVDDEVLTEKAFSEKYNVQFTPTSLLFDESGTVIKRVNGFRGKDSYVDSLRSAVDESKVPVSDRDDNSLANKSKLPSSIKPYIHNSSDVINIESPIALYVYDSDCESCEAVTSVMETEGLWQKFTQLNLTATNWSDNLAVQSKQGNTSVKKLVGEETLGQSPTILFLDKTGREIIRLDSLFKSFHMNGVLDYVLSEDYRTQPNFQRYLSAKADAIRESGKDVNIWE